MESGIDHDGDGHRDFDNLIGRWTIHNKRLDQRLVGSQKWLAFEANSDVRPALGGIGNVEEYHALFPDGKPVVGMTVRIFDLSTRLWSLYWADSRSGKLGPPVIGRFRNGVGEFMGDDLQDGVPVKVKFRWSDITPSSARWEQAMSADGGTTWEWNWEMVFVRASEPAGQ